jgi:hypothetical protein
LNPNVSSIGENRPVAATASVSDDDEYNSGAGSFDTEFYAEDLTTFTEEVDLVFVGTGDCDNADIMITDDYTTFTVFINGVYQKKDWRGYESDGFVTIMTLDQYYKWYNKVKKDIGDLNDAGVEGFVVSGLKGAIQVGAKNEHGEYVRGINMNDYIQHQFEDCYDVFINLPAGATIHNLNRDLTLPISVIRDKKIENILQDSSDVKSEFIEILLDRSRVGNDFDKVYMDMNKMRNYKPIGSRVPKNVIDIIENKEYIDLTCGGQGDDDWWSDEEENMFEQGVISWDRPTSGLRDCEFQISFC